MGITQQIVHVKDLAFSPWRWSIPTERDKHVLDASVRRYGVLNPIHVRTVEGSFSGEPYEIIDGHARVESFVRGIHGHELELVAVVHDGIDDAQALQLAIELNLARVTMDHVVISRALGELVKTKGKDLVEDLIPWDKRNVESYILRANFDWEDYKAKGQENQTFETMFADEQSPEEIAIADDNSNGGPF